MELAKWLVMRMVNRMATASFTGRNGRSEHLAFKIARKLLNGGSMTVRELMRKSHNLSTADCHEALQFLADDGIVTISDNKWGIRSDTEAGRAYLVTRMNPKTKQSALTC